ncbi:hypothetical protein [Mesorhizobium abyssinicae]|uniref:hypothetical protein n=1 Tax=Mesorhizobium abyssinicae TaxID=1209958 RepID=UPI0033958700
MQNAQSLTPHHIASIRALLGQLPASSASAAVNGSDLHNAMNALDEIAENRWEERPSEYVTPGRSDMLGMVLVRKRRQLAYSVKLSNLARDPFASIPAIALGATGASALPTLIAAPPVTFPSFLLSIALAWVRAFAQPIGYGEAALLHHMNQIAAIKGKVSLEDLADAGRVLVDFYGYVKGQNGNEISALLASLSSWKAIEEFDGGFRVAESVPYGFGPIEYAP